MAWLDGDGYFVFGKHEGESAHNVALDDRSYLNWVLENAESLSDEDRKTIETELKYAGRNRSWR